MALGGPDLQLTSELFDKKPLFDLLGRPFFGKDIGKTGKYPIPEVKSVHFFPQGIPTDTPILLEKGPFCVLRG